MDRMDALEGRARDRLRHLRGAVLDGDPHPALQDLVARAHAAVPSSAAMLTLCLEHTEVIRAHIGLPEDLAAALGVDRDASPGQLVVAQGAPLVVGAAAVREDIPRLFLDRLGYSAYLGAPVMLGGHVVGVLAILDVAARTFDGADVATLSSLAREAGDLLALLEGPATIPGAAIGGETGHTIDRLAAGSASALVAVAELMPLLRLSRSAVDARRMCALLENTARAAQDLHAAVDEIASAVTDLAPEMMEKSRRKGAPPGSVGAVIADADELVHSSTAMAGGVTWSVDDAHARVEDPDTSAAALAVMLTELSRRLLVTGTPDGIAVDVRKGAEDIAIWLTTRLPLKERIGAVLTVDEALGGLEMDPRAVRVGASEAAVVIRLARRRAGDTDTVVFDVDLSA
jgi:hypothetical protein